MSDSEYAQDKAFIFENTARFLLTHLKQREGGRPNHYEEGTLRLVLTVLDQPHREALVERLVATLKKTKSPALAKLCRTHSRGPRTKCITKFAARIHAEPNATTCLCWVERAGHSIWGEVEQALQSFLTNRKSTDSPFSLRWTKLTGMFRLDEIEQKVLLFYVLPELLEVAHKLWIFWLDYDESKNKAEDIAVLFDISPRHFLSILSVKKRLHQSGLITVRDDNDGTVSVPEHVVDFLSGASSESIESVFFKEEVGVPELTLKDFSIPEAELDTLLSLLQCPTRANILFYGPPGSGKTELAKTLIRAVGKRPFFITEGNGKGDDVRRSGLVAANNVLNTSESVIIADEAEHLLAIGGRRSFGWMLRTRNESEPDKAWLHQFLETTPHKIFWIVNDHEFISEAVLRRLTMSLEFHRPAECQRRRAWELHVQKKNADFITPEIIQTFARDFDISAAAIAQTVSTVVGMNLAEASPERVKQTLGTLLRQHMRLVSGETKRPTSEPKGYSIDGLNTDTSLSEVIKSAAQFGQYLECDSDGTGRIRNMNILLYGPPGSGKTEFAKHLARELRKKLIVRRGSDLFSKYWGETEKNIRIF